jgi:hypothetical protein
MARISSQGTVALLEIAPRNAGVAATAATAAAPAVITVGSGNMTDFTAGVWVYVEAVGWDSVHGKVFKVKNPSGAAGTFELAGSDTTGETNWPASAKVYALDFSEVCFNQISRDSPASATVDVTTLCDEARVTVSGMPAPGTITFGGFYDSVDEGYQELRNAYEGGEDRWFVINMRDGSVIAMLININSLGESLGVDQGVSFSSGANVSGRPIYYTAAALA